jgi:large subunit ribosomal protein L24
MIKKLHIRKDDTVKVISGADNGKEGRVLAIDRTKNRAFVEGVNMVSKHTKPTAQYPQGGIIKKEASIHISNLLVDGSKNPTRIGRRADANGKLVRFSKKSGEDIKL